MAQVIAALTLLICLGSTIQGAVIPPNTAIPRLYNTTLLQVPGAGSNDIYVPACCPMASSPSPSSGTVAAASIEGSTQAGCPLNQPMLSGGYGKGHWGFWYDGLAPSMVVTSGSEFEVKMPTFVSGQAWTEMGVGDPEIEEMYDWTTAGPKINMRGPQGASGGHFMTGPVYVCGAEPGDMLQVDILDLVPRPNPGYNNRSFGITTNGGIGWFARQGGAGGYITPGYMTNRSVSVVYEALKDNVTGKAYAWSPQYAYDFNSPLIGAATPGCVPQNGSIPNTTAAGAGTWSNPDYLFGSKSVPCTPTGQNFSYPYGGYSAQKLTVPESIRDYSVRNAYRVPINMHIGNMGLAPKLGVPIITSPPMRTGGNIDNKRIGIGATMYYPVEVVGALLSMGDCHGAQGDGESGSTGIETSLNGRFRVTLHKRNSLPNFLRTVNYPLLENANEFLLHGYAYADWIREIPDPQTNVSKPYPFGGTDMNRAMSVAYNQTREFIMNTYFQNRTLSEDLAINVMSNTVDFGITQIVDSNVGIHSIIPKWAFNSSAWAAKPSYEAENKCGTSRASYP